jgi:uncharacterized tellurite resistance protein B-like protein
VQLYHGAQLSRAKTDSGIDCVRQRTSVLGRAVYEDFVIEEGKGDTWVKRVVGGPNDGAFYVAEFASEGDATRVTIHAYAPPGGFTSGMGKLSQLGMEKALQKLLQEHQKAIGDYNQAAQHTLAQAALAKIGDLLAPLAALAAPELSSLVKTILETAALVAIADRNADEREREAMNDVAVALCGMQLGEATRDKLIAHAERAVEALGMEERCAGLGKRLAALGHSTLGIAIATVVAEASHGIDRHEMAAIRRLAESAGVGEPDLIALLTRIGEATSSRASATPS